jgi:hypothetical protein
LAAPHRAVRCGHAAAKVDGHSERHLGDRLGESGARRQHMDTADTALKADVVVDVLKEISLGVEDARSFDARSRRDFRMSLWPIKSATSGRWGSKHSAGMRPGPS